MNVLMLCMILLALTFPDAWLSVDEANSNFLKYDVSEVFVGELKHTIQIINPWQNVVAGGKLVVPLLKNQTGRHYVVLQNFSAKGDQFSGPTYLSDGFGNVYFCWEGITIFPGNNFTVELDYLVLSFSVKYPVDANLAGDYDVNSKVYRLYTQPEELIQSDNPKIAETAQKVVGKEKNPHERALLIYNFVTKHLEYEIQDRERGALWALENGKGDCSEYSYLFVALCRAVGIPARIQAGFAFHHDNEVLEDGHMWAEYYLENYGWIPVDAAWGMFSSIDHKHLSSIQSVPEVMSYANFLFGGAGSKPLENKQTIWLRRVSTIRFSDSQFADKIMAAVQKTRLAEFTIFLGRFLGVKFTLPSEVKNVEQKILTNKICIQMAVDSWGEKPTVAVYNAVRALEGAEDALKDAWMLTAKVFTLYIAMALLLVLIFLALLKRVSKKPLEAQAI